MDKENIVIATMPIKPQDKTNLGMYIAPTIMDVVGEKLECRKVFSMNLLNTYKDKSNCKDIYLQDIERNGTDKGKGQPESLKHELSGYWSRRIDKENRLVYKVEEEKLYIVQCGTHYKQ